MSEAQLKTGVIGPVNQLMAEPIIRPEFSKLVAVKSFNTDYMCCSTHHNFTKIEFFSDVHNALCCRFNGNSVRNEHSESEHFAKPNFHTAPFSLSKMVISVADTPNTWSAAKVCKPGYHPSTGGIR